MNWNKFKIVGKFVIAKKVFRRRLSKGILLSDDRCPNLALVYASGIDGIVPGNVILVEPLAGEQANLAKGEGSHLLANDKLFLKYKQNEIGATVALEQHDLDEIYAEFGDVDTCDLPFDPDSILVEQEACQV